MGYPIPFCSCSKAIEVGKIFHCLDLFDDKIRFLIDDCNQGRFIKYDFVRAIIFIYIIYRCYEIIFYNKDLYINYILTPTSQLT